MGTGAGSSRDHYRVTIVKPSSVSVSIPRDSSPLPNEIFVEEIYGVLGRPVVYCSCGNLLLGFEGT